MTVIQPSDPIKKVIIKKESGGELTLGSRLLRLPDGSSSPSSLSFPLYKRISGALDEAEHIIVEHEDGVFDHYGGISLGYIDGAGYIRFSARTYYASEEKERDMKLENVSQAKALQEEVIWALCSLPVNHYVRLWYDWTGTIYKFIDFDSYALQEERVDVAEFNTPQEFVDAVKRLNGIVEPLSCPSCGGDQDQIRISKEKYYQAYCTLCGVSGPYVKEADEKEAYAAWNELVEKMSE